MEIFSLFKEMRGGEAFIVAKAIFPPRAPPLWPRSCSAFWECGKMLDRAMDAAVLGVRG